MRSSVTPLRGILTGILTGALALAALGDLTTDTTGVIVRGADIDAVAAAVADHGGAVDLEIGLIDAVSADVPVDLVDELAADPRTVEVTPDGQVQLLSLHTAESPGTRQTPHEALLALGGGSRFASRFDGSGIDVALVDSGVEPSAVSGRVQAGVDVSMATSEDRDGYGHGTSMAGIITEVAPGARVIDVKVADERGIADVSQVLAGIDWTITNRNTDGRNIRVMSLSFGSDGTNSAATSPLTYAVEAAWRHGITVAVAAGNHGDQLGRLLTPAISPWVVAVGAADTTDVSPRRNRGRAAARRAWVARGRTVLGIRDTRIPSWSAAGDGHRNPDVVAPGRSILGGLAPNSVIARENPDAVVDDRLLGSGTSQATAFTAGVLAKVFDARSNLSPNEAKAVLTNSAFDLSAPDLRAGHGVLHVRRLLHPRNLRGRIHDVQRHSSWSDGTGPLDGDRGSYVLEDAAGNLLTGELTVVGPFDSDAWTGSTWTGSSWTGSTWTGSTWTGSTWTGSTWTGSTWTGSTWTGSTWTLNPWTNVRWGE